MSWIKNALWTAICIVCAVLISFILTGAKSFTGTIDVALSGQYIIIPMYYIQALIFICIWYIVYIFRFLMGYKTLADTVFFNIASIIFISTLGYGIYSLQNIKGAAAMMAFAKPEYAAVAEKAIQAAVMSQVFLGSVACIALIPVIISVYKYKKAVGGARRTNS